MHDYDEIDLTEFSLACLFCDDGDGVHREVDALIAGWGEIEYRPDLPKASYSGACPDCHEAYERWQ